MPDRRGPDVYFDFSGNQGAVSTTFIQYLLNSWVNFLHFAHVHAGS